MSHAVGPKGQVVIAKEIRDRLGVRPGLIWAAARSSSNGIVYSFDDRFPSDGIEERQTPPGAA